MYRIDYSDLRDAAVTMYRFMTIPTLTRPECTIWGDSLPPDTITNTGTDFISEEEFCQKIISASASAVICVASTDRADKRRVVLSLIPSLGYLVLNFPTAANGNLTWKEKDLMRMLQTS